MEAFNSLSGKEEDKKEIAGFTLTLGWESLLEDEGIPVSGGWGPCFHLNEVMIKELQVPTISPSKPWEMPWAAAAHAKSAM